MRKLNFPMGLACKMVSSLCFADVVQQEPGAAQAAAQASLKPVIVRCPACNTQVQSTVNYSMGAFGWIW